MENDPSRSPKKPSYRVFVRGLAVLYALYFFPLLIGSITTIHNRGLKIFIQGVDWVWKVWVFLGGGTILLLLGIDYLWRKYSGKRIGAWVLLILFFFLVFIPSAWVSLVGFMFITQM